MRAANKIRRGGRQPGTPNRVTAEVRSIAQYQGPAAVAELARLAFNSRSEMVRIAACKELLDRAYGRPGVAVDVTQPSDPRQMTDAQIANELSELLNRAAARRDAVITVIASEEKG